MATFNISTGNQYISGYVECTESEVSTANNTSKVTVTAYIRRTNIYSGDPTYGYNVTPTIKIGDYTYSENLGSKTVPNDRTYIQVGTCYTTVSHLTDGTKTVTIKYSLTNSNSKSGFTVTETSYDFTLSTIARKANVTSAENFETWDSPEITFTNPGGFQLQPYINFYYKNDPQGAGTVLYSLTRAKGTYSSPYAFSFNDATEKTAILNALYEDDEYVVYEGVQTFNGNTSLGWSSLGKTFTIEENNDTRPSVSVLATINNGSLPSTFNGLWIQNKSRANVTITASGKYNATITGLSTSANGSTYTTSSFTTNVISSSGSQSISTTATDSRGFTNTASASISVIAYSKPTVSPLSGQSSVQVYRSDSSGNKSSSSTSVWVKAKRSYSTVTSSGVQKNFCALQFRYKETSGSWSNWIDLIAKANTSTNDYNGLISGVSFNITKSYTIEIRVVDDIGESHLYTTDIPTQDVALHLGAGGKHTGIGKYCDTSKPNSFQCGWEAFFDGDVTIDGALILDKLYPKLNPTGTLTPTIIFFPVVPYQLIEPNHDTELYLKELTKWLCTQYPDVEYALFIGLAEPNAVGITLLNVYDTSAVDSNGYPAYASGIYNEISGQIKRFGFYNYTYYFN